MREKLKTVLNNEFYSAAFLAAGICSSYFLNPIYGSLVIFFAVVISSTSLFTEEINLQPIAIVSTLFIGLSPIYLILRGLFTREVLTEWDLQIYALLFFIFSLLISIRDKKHRKNTVNPLSLILSQKVFVGFTSLWLALVVQEILLNRSVGNAVAWAAGGDSKNHLVNGVSITEYGFLDPTTFYTQPVSSPTYLALVLSQGGIDVGSNIQLLQYQMQVYSYVWILLIGVLGLVFAATAETIWNKLRNHTFPVSPFILVGASVLPTFSYLLGSALFDGFFTAIFGICAVVLMISWVLEISEKQRVSISSILLGLSIFSTTLMAWMFVVPFSFAIMVLGIRNNLLTKVKSKVRLDFCILVLLTISALTIHFSIFGQSLIRNAKFALNTPGAANVTPPNIFYASLLILIILGFAIKESNKKLGESLAAISLIQFGVLFSFKIFSNLNLFSWNYYLLKYQWIMFASISALLFALASAKLFDTIKKNYKLKITSFVFILLATFLISESIVGVNNVYKKIWNGWDSPRAVTLDKMFEFEINKSVPTLFFHFGYAGESRMANFWLTAFTEPVEPLKGWNYTIDTTGNPQQMCDVNHYYPKVQLVTSDAKIEEQLNELCPEEKFQIYLERPLFPN